jgi:hypothetical protein
VVRGVAGVQELQELQDKKIGIAPRMLIFLDRGVFRGVGSQIFQLVAELQASNAVRRTCFRETAAWDRKTRTKDDHDDEKMKP